MSKTCSSLPYLKNSIVYAAKTDRVWVYSQSALYSFPLQVMYSGYSDWGPSDFFKREINQATHYGFELILAGNMEVHQDKVKLIAGPGNLVFFKKGVPHFYKTGPDGFVKKRFIWFSGSLADAILENAGLLQHNIFTIKRQDHLFSLIAMLKKANRLMGSDDQYRENDLSSLMYRLIMEVRTCVDHTTYPAAVVKALEIIEKNVHSNISGPQIATYASISERHCNRLFKQHFGVGSAKYFMQRKMEHAGVLLKNTSLSVKEVANKVGVDNQLNFSTQFKRVTGVSPRGFRQKK